MDNNYYQTIIVKINHLITEKNFSQAFALVKEELAVAYIPQEFQEQLQKLHDEIIFNLKEQQATLNTTNNFWTLAKITEVLNDLVNQEQHATACYFLQNYNVRLILPVITNYLLNPNITNINKTRLLLLLKNQNIDQEFQVTKLPCNFVINPIKLTAWYDLKVYQQINQLLEQVVYVDNPGLFQICFYLLNNYFESLMPEIPSLKHVNAIAAAVYIRACSLQFNRVTLLLSAKMFHSTTVLIKKYLVELKKHKIS
ncbi:MAG: DUF3196 family protein [Spiroplasma sp.]|nr:DUF3196 family protein [Spiroplasma sp.]